MSEYDTDILLWSEHQADLLRRRAAGKLVNDAALDWPNIIEEIESVGRSELHAVESLIVQALLRRLKTEAWPNARDAPHWRAEAIGFRSDAASHFTESMRQRIDIAKLYRRALRRLPESLEGHAPLPVRLDCPATLDDLLREEPD